MGSCWWVCKVGERWDEVKKDAVNDRLDGYEKGGVSNEWKLLYLLVECVDDR